MKTRVRVANVQFQVESLTNAGMNSDWQLCPKNDAVFLPPPINKYKKANIILLKHVKAHNIDLITKKKEKLVFMENAQ